MLERLCSCYCSDDWIFYMSKSNKVVGYSLQTVRSPHPPLCRLASSHRIVDVLTSRVFSTHVPSSSPHGLHTFSRNGEYEVIYVRSVLLESKVRLTRGHEGYIAPIHYAATGSESEWRDLSVYIHRHRV